MKFGTQFIGEGVRFRLWAPYSDRVSLKLVEIDRIVEMESLPRGWFEVEMAEARAGMRYSFVLPTGQEVPDPASRFQPEDVNGPSEIIDPYDFTWTDRGWRGRPWEEHVIYELHIGTFTQEGSYRAAMNKLDHLVELGITAIELMPLGDFPGGWNWGYDGAYLFAPDASYGRPEELKALINAAHGKGISVFLDVVYNHFGPKGNYMPGYTPLMTDKHDTPWGSAVNFDAEGSELVRDLIFANARYWLNEYHFDGLRFDAVHAIRDSGPRHVLEDLAQQIRASTDGRYVHLIVENSDNQAGWLKRRDDGAPWLYDAQWSDDIHHGLHAAITGEDAWYYADYAGRVDLVARGLAEGLAWQGEYMEQERRSKGEASAFLPATAFVAYAQNHDQTGNRPFGERINTVVHANKARLWSAIYLLSPQIPMLFMGEEWGAKEPFTFFSDVGDDLADAIREGRKEEIKSFLQIDDREPPDPVSRETFEQCKLDWDRVTVEEHAGILAFYKRLIALRREKIAPRLTGMSGHSGRFEMLGAHAFWVEWILGDGSQLRLTANLSAEPLTGVDLWTADHLWLEGFASGDTLEAWSAVFDLKNKPGQE